MITVHHLNNSRSQRVLWLLEELRLPYEIQHYELG
jgi:glutathione S-transferase